MTNEPHNALRPAQPSTLALTRPAQLDLSGEISTDVREFMHRPPHWLLRSGTTVLAAVMALLLILSLVIKYPDTIAGRVTVIGTQPVMEVVARQSGHLESLRVREGQQVKKGEILAVMQSPARSATVLELAEKLRQVEFGSDAKTPVVEGGFRAEGRSRETAGTLCGFSQCLSISSRAGWPMITRRKPGHSCASNWRANARRSSHSAARPG